MSSEEIEDTALTRREDSHQTDSEFSSPCLTKHERENERLRFPCLHGSDDALGPPAPQPGRRLAHRRTRSPPTHQPSFRVKAAGSLFFCYLSEPAGMYCLTGGSRSVHQHSLLHIGLLNRTMEKDREPYCMSKLDSSHSRMKQPGSRTGTCLCKSCSGIGDSLER